MAMISKTVTGSTEDMKYMKNAKNYPKSAMGGTERTSFTGSNDPRSSGPVGPNNMLQDAPGLVDQGPEMMNVTKGYQGGTDDSTGPKTGGGMTPAIRVANESNGNFGGRVIKDMK
jgi:hypothetical protein